MNCCCFFQRNGKNFECYCFSYFRKKSVFRRRKIKFYFCSALWIFFPGGNIRAGNFTWFCRGGNQPDSCHGGRRVGPCQRHCCIYRHVHVLERISQHPCCHDGQPEREAVYRNSHCLPYHRRIMCRDFSESAVPDVDDVTIR